MDVFSNHQQPRENYKSRCLQMWTGYPPLVISFYQAQNVHPFGGFCTVFHHSCKQLPYEIMTEAHMKFFSP